MSNRSLEVRLTGVLVGHLDAVADGRLAFRVHPSYVDLPRRPVLGQRIEDDPSRVWLEKSEVLPRWFGHLLPDRSGRLRALVCAAHDLELGDDAGVLEVLGRDLPGAVVVTPDPGEPSREPLDVQPAADEPRLDPSPWRYSLAGVQLKLSVVAQGDRISLPGRNVDGNHILKLAGLGFDGVAENEATMMEWARASGFDVAESRLVDLGEVEGLTVPRPDLAPRALLVRRFDRTPGGRIHQEDLAQVVHVPASEAAKYSGTTYSKLGRVARHALGEEGLFEYVRRLALVVAQGNADAHLKNWSLRYEDPVRATWAPLYDQNSTVAWPRLDAKLALRFGTVEDFGQVTRSAFAQLGKVAGIPPRRCEDLAIETLERLRAAWPRVLEHSELLTAHREKLVEHWRSVPLLREVGRLEG